MKKKPGFFSKAQETAVLTQERKKLNKSKTERMPGCRMQGPTVWKPILQQQLRK